MVKYELWWWLHCCNFSRFAVGPVIARVAVVWDCVITISKSLKIYCITQVLLVVFSRLSCWLVIRPDNKTFTRTWCVESGKHLKSYRWESFLFPHCAHALWNTFQWFTMATKTKKRCSSHLGKTFCFVLMVNMGTHFEKTNKPKHESPLQWQRTEGWCGRELLSDWIHKSGSQN